MGTGTNCARTDFERRLAFGRIIETDIAWWIISRGGCDLTIYDIKCETGKGPRLRATSYGLALTGET